MRVHFRAVVLVHEHCNLCNVFWCCKHQTCYLTWRVFLFSMSVNTPTFPQNFFCWYNFFLVSSKRHMTDLWKRTTKKRLVIMMLLNCYGTFLFVLQISKTQGCEAAGIAPLNPAVFDGDDDDDDFHLQIYLNPLQIQLTRTLLDMKLAPLNDNSGASPKHSAHHIPNRKCI